MGSIADVTNGQINISETSQKTERNTGSALGKDDFLQLLVTQMKYQDPLEPADNTEYVSQLAQFSELEEMENLNNTTTNTSAFNLVGKMVYIEDQSSTGQISSVEGQVDYVSMQNGEAYVSVNGELYAYDKIVKVIDTDYVVSQYVPGVAAQDLTYRHHDPQDVTVSGINLGSNGYEATGFTVILVDSEGQTSFVEQKFLKFEKGRLTIDKEYLATLEAGTYSLAFAFNDGNATVDSGKVILNIKGLKADE